MALYKFRIIIIIIIIPLLVYRYSLSSPITNLHMTTPHVSGSSVCSDVIAITSVIV